MTATVCLLANTIHYPFGGGHFWAYLNWALGLRAIGCNVIWMERASYGECWNYQFFESLK